jgi:hypothetical protein
MPSIFHMALAYADVPRDVRKHKPAPAPKPIAENQSKPAGQTSEGIEP